MYRFLPPVSVLKIPESLLTDNSREKKRTGAQLLRSISKCTWGNNSVTKDFRARAM